MDANSSEDLLSRRLGDIHSSACFLAQHIPSMVSAAESDTLRKLLNLYLDVVQDNADRTEVDLGVVPDRSVARDPTAVPAMVDDLFDLIDRIDEPALVDVAILLSSNEIGSLEARRLHLLSDFAERHMRWRKTLAMMTRETR
ncbi:hypothetical protein [uncultured Roseobacter sp.]|uniref:hypothetical protein n=1 Tax=uncultured Roseobacter sp. TaxID=114847 RepID=UPI002619528D|nr:hypothetical protein [uncultured Roseobacter sp.]